MKISNKIISFTDSRSAFDFLKTTKEQPFIIFSDVNLPAQNGMEFKKRWMQINNCGKKASPFVFYSTFVSRDIVNEAYTKMTIQGFFGKGTPYNEIKSDIKIIVDYWQICKRPNKE